MKLSPVRIVATLLLSSAGILAAPTAAFAHTALVGAFPLPGSVVHALPEQVSLTFASDLLTTTSAANMMSVTDPMGMVISAPTANVHGNTMSTVLSPKMLMDGAYTVGFRVVSPDTHIVTGSFKFTLQTTMTSASPSPGGSQARQGAAYLTAHANAAGIIDGKGQSNGSADGSFTIDFTQGMFCATVRTSHLGKVIGIHIHSMNTKNMTISDLIYVPVGLDALNATRPVCTKQDPMALATLADHASNYMMMVHTASYPSGAVGGMLMVTHTSSSPSPSTAPNGTATTASTGGATIWILVGLGLIVLVALLAWLAIRARSSDDQGSE